MRLKYFRIVSVFQPVEQVDEATQGTILGIDFLKARDILHKNVVGPDGLDERVDFIEQGRVLVSAVPGRPLPSERLAGSASRKQQRSIRRGNQILWLKISDIPQEKFHFRKISGKRAFGIGIVVDSRENRLARIPQSGARASASTEKIDYPDYGCLTVCNLLFSYNIKILPFVQILQSRDNGSGSA